MCVCSIRNVPTVNTFIHLNELEKVKWKNTNSFNSFKMLFKYHAELKLQRAFLQVKTPFEVMLVFQPVNHEFQPDKTHLCEHLKEKGMNKIQIFLVL